MPSPMVAIIIIPNCLSVDRAIIFFMSHSVMALNPAIVVVDTAFLIIIKLMNFAAQRMK